MLFLQLHPISRLIMNLVPCRQHLLLSQEYYGSYSHNKINGQVLKDRGVKHHDNIILLLCAHNTHVHQTSILMM